MVLQYKGIYLIVCMWPCGHLLFCTKELFIFLLKQSLNLKIGVKYTLGTICLGKLVNVLNNPALRDMVL